MNDRNPQRGQPPRKAPEGLPSPEILEAYDTVLQGSAGRIIEMFEREQQHRHAWELRALKVHQVSTLLGQFFGFLIGLSIFISAGVIGRYGNPTIGAFIWVFGLAIVTMSAIVWWYAKSMGQRPLFARPAMRTTFRPDKGASARED